MSEIERASEIKQPITKKTGLHTKGKLVIIGLWVTPLQVQSLLAVALKQSRQSKRSLRQGCPSKR
jgi:hypothetical protein